MPGATKSFTYDTYGRVQTSTDSDGYVLTYEYDALIGRRRSLFPMGPSSNRFYNRLDVEKRRDRSGHWVQSFHDALRRPVAVRDPVGETTTYQWCSCGSLDKVIDGNNAATTWERDLQGRVTREVRANSATKEVTYETTTSRVKKVKDAKNQETQYTYFLDGRLQQVSYVNAQIPTPAVTFSYTDPSTSVLDPYGRLRQLMDGAGTTAYSYNPVTTPAALGAARLASIDGPSANDTIAYGYDELGRLRTRTLAGATETRTFDAVGRLTTLTDPVVLSGSPISEVRIASTY